MSDSQPAIPLPAAPTHRWIATLWLLLALAVSIAAALAWKVFSEPSVSDDSIDVSAEALDARLLQVEAATASSHRSQGALNQRLSDVSARTGLLRDEILGVTQRAALLEDSVRELSGNRRGATMALRLDEAELLLTIAQERLRLANDLAGALRATELADGVLTALRDPALIDVRQTLAQELNALRALPEDPQAVAAGELDALEAVLPQLMAGGPARPAVKALPRGSGFERLLDALVQVRPSGDQDLLSPADRSAGEAALSLEIALARTALERRDQARFQQSLQRMDSWLRRLYADGPLLRERRGRLKTLGVLPLAYRLPFIGATLEQLRALQHDRGASP